MTVLRFSLLFTFSLVLLIARPALLPAQDAIETQSDSTVTSDKGSLHARLLGGWLLAGKPGTSEEPKAGARMRFFGHGHWLITQADPDTGAVMFHHGGTYTLDGDTLTAKTTFATEPTANMIGQNKTFKVTVEDGTYTQIGIDNPWSESWRRAK